jgi:hypothetical protein
MLRSLTLSRIYLGLWCVRAIGSRASGSLLAEAIQPHDFGAFARLRRLIFFF